MHEVKPLALVTGASSGIGAAFARRLAAEGHNLVLVARRKERLSELAEELEKSYGVSAEALPADLTNDAELQVVERRIARAKSVEFLVNNAGFGTVGRFFEIDLEEQDKMHRLHVMTTVRLTHAALVGMVARGKGSVVNVSSVAAFWCSPGNASYCATKAWVNSFTEGLHLELKSKGSPVRVQALCPGFTLSEFHDTMRFDRKLIPAGLWMSAEDVVSASLEGLARGKLIVVPGWRYQFSALLSKLLPQFLRHAVVMRYAQRTHRT